MSKKQFEDIEKKFREAAENYQPPVTPQAWERMEALLDRDANRKRRPAGLWLWALLLLIGTAATGVLVYTLTPESARPVVNTSVQKEKGINQRRELVKPPAETVRVDVDNSKKTNRKETTGISRSGKKVAVIPQLPTKQDQVKEEYKPERSSNTAVASLEKRRASMSNRKNEVAKQASNQPSEKAKGAKTDHRSITREQLQNLLGIQDKQGKPSPGNNNPVTKRELTFTQKATENSTVNTNINTKDTEPDGLKKPADTISTNTTTAAIKPGTLPVPEIKQQQLSVPEISSRLYFTASLGLDGNAVKGASIRNFTGIYGIGIGYNVNNRVSIQTGLYAGNKRYTADSNSYELKGNYWPMVSIKAIDAECYVINVPVSVRYNFLSNPKRQFYSVAGLSSYFMQKESYLYIYSYRNSNVLRYRTEVYGDNRHWLSVLDLSLGYEHKLSRRLSLQGEPYLKLPLNGVGDGQVQLYSAGLLIGLKFTPY